MKSRIRLPEGFVRFRKDLGRILRRHRRSEELLQRELAATVGISRERLSRIERGKAWPSYETIYRLMGQFNLEWHQIAIAGSGRVPRFYRDEMRDDHRADLGAALRAGRKIEQWSLRHLAERCDLSYAQLSRIERGEALSSKVLEENPGDRKRQYNQRRMRFRNPLLDRLAQQGRASLEE